MPQVVGSSRKAAGEASQPDEPQPTPEESGGSHEIPGGITAAFGVPVFRRIWAASFCSNIGMVVQMVGSGWAMTQLSGSPTLVALVQTALWGPTMLFAMPAGAIADTYDRRKVAIIASLIALTGATGLATSSGLGVLSPHLLLGFCAVIGLGGALLGPVWQASVVEQVPRALLPSAIGLTSIAWNLARSFGPAVGGAIVAAAGPVAAFITNVACYLPSLVVLILWKRRPPPIHQTREGMVQSIASGLRYIVRAPPIRAIILRSFTVSLPGGAVTSLMPLASRDLLQGGAQAYGLLLGAFGLGSVVGALNLTWLRNRLSTEILLCLCAASAGACVLTEALVRSLPAMLVALFIADAFWVINFSVFNIELQTWAPDRVVGRAVAALQAATSGGAAIGAALWGVAAREWGVQWALASAALAMGACALLGLWLKVGQSAPSSIEHAAL